MAKLELYRKFTNTLAVSVLLSIAWIGFEVGIFGEKKRSSRAEMRCIALECLFGSQYC